MHILEGELSHPSLPLMPGHKIVGPVHALGAGVDTPKVSRLHLIETAAAVFQVIELARNETEKSVAHLIKPIFDNLAGDESYCVIFALGNR